MRKKILIGVLICASGIAHTVCLNTPIEDMSRAAIKTRLQPPGMGVVAVGPAVVQRAVDAPARTPKEIYDTHCVICHGSGVAGAPKLKDAAAWSPRLKQGMEILLKHVKEGYKVMPAMGTCADCSDKEFQDTIKLMSDK